WLNEREKNEICFNGSIDSMDGGAKDDGSTAVFVAARISNACNNPSVATRYKLYAKLPNQPEESFGPTAFVGPIMEFTPEKGPKMLFRKEYMLYEKTINPIVPGS